jgi:succinoglycan biosynthesis transport protein ExoP
MELRQYWQIILKRRGALLKIIGLIVGTVILGSFLFSPVYQFKCNILVKTGDPRATLIGMSQDLTSLGTINHELEMYGQLAMIKNLTMIQDVITRMGLEKKKGTPFSPTEFLDPSGMTLLIYKKGVRLIVLASTQIIQVSGFSGSPEEAVEIANQVAAGFVALCNQKIQAAAQQALKYIQESLPQVAARLKQADDALAEYKVANHLSNITVMREKLITSLNTLQETKVENETDLAEIDNRLAQVQAKLKKIPEFQKSSIEYRANATLGYIREKLMDAEANRASGGIKATPEYYSQKQFRASIEKLKDEYRKQAVKVFQSETSSRNSLYSSLIQTMVEKEIDKVVKTSRRQLLNQQILDKQKELDGLTLKELHMGPLQREVTALQTALANLLSQEQTARLASNLKLSNATIIERATVPAIASQIKNFRWFPKRKKLLVFSFVFALLLGMTTILLQEYLDDTFSDPGGTEEYLKLPVLASLPELPPLETFDLHRVMAYAPWTQAIWALPYMVKPAGQESLSGVWGVTSANAGEGKSLVAAGLGWALALRDLRVLMIDLNFFRPRLPSLWNLAPAEGVCELLQGKASLSDCVRKVGPGELYLLANGKAAEVAWSQLDLKVLASWLTTVRTGFDVLVLDLPPVGAGEGAILAALAEQILMVVRADHSPKTQVARALEQIQRCHGKIAGLVLNRCYMLELWPLLSPTISAVTSWPPVQRLITSANELWIRLSKKK